MKGCTSILRLWEFRKYETAIAKHKPLSKGGWLDQLSITTSCL
jgi:hypothetical protein